MPSAKVVISDIRVDGLERLGRMRDLTVGALEKLLGLGGGPVSCLLVEAALPAEAVGPAGMPSDSVGALGKEHFQAHVHPSPLDRVRSLARLEQKDLWTLFWYAVATGGLYLAIPLAVDAMVTNIAFGGQQRVYVQALLVLAAVLGAFLLLYASIRALAFVVIERLQRRLFVRFTADLAARLPKVSQAEFDKVHGPELTNRFFDIMTLQKAAAQLLLDGLDVILSFLIGSLVLAFYDWTLFWFDAGLFVLIALVIRGFGRGGVNSSIEESRAKYATAGWLQQVALFSGAFKSPGGEALAEERADAYAREYLKHRRTHFKILFRQVVGLLAIEVVATTALLVWGGFLVLSGKLSIGQLVASELILTATLAASAKFGKQLETAYDLLTAVDKIGHLVDLRMERSGGSSPSTPSPAGASVHVRGIHFGYSADRPVFRGLEVSNWLSTPTMSTALVGRAVPMISVTRESMRRMTPVCPAALVTTTFWPEPKVAASRLTLTLRITTRRPSRFSRRAKSLEPASKTAGVGKAAPLPTTVTEVAALVAFGANWSRPLKKPIGVKPWRDAKALWLSTAAAAKPVNWSGSTGDSRSCFMPRTVLINEDMMTTQ
jgi:hypothetical protein